MGAGLRFDRLDALRGAAIVWMALFHFCFDLNTFGLLQPRQNFYTDPFWTWQRTCIVSLFLFCAGLGQAAALHAGQGWPRFWRRWAQVAGLRGAGQHRLGAGCFRAAGSASACCTASP